jgi:hypothetical protein
MRLGIDAGAGDAFVTERDAVDRLRFSRALGVGDRTLVLGVGLSLCGLDRLIVSRPAARAIGIERIGEDLDSVVAVLQRTDHPLVPGRFDDREVSRSRCQETAAPSPRARWS